MPRTKPLLLLACALTALSLVACSSFMSKPMTFFVSSTGGGKGGDFGGLAGADRLCANLASAVGTGGKSWRAYLSAQPVDGRPAVHARDRIGPGPWRNANGAVIAQNVGELHGASNKLTKDTALDETGKVVNGRGDTPNMHDILTGSQPDGTAIAGAVDTTCGNWTKSGEGAAMVGHHDRTGLDDSVPARSWNSSHQSRGCSHDALKASGGDGRIYCFAAN